MSIRPNHSRQSATSSWRLHSIQDKDPILDTTIDARHLRVMAVAVVDAHIYAHLKKGVLRVAPHAQPARQRNGAESDAERARGVVGNGAGEALDLREIKKPHRE